MKRVLTATCLAASFAVGLAAQSTGTAGTPTAGTAGTTAQDPQPGQGRGGGPRTVTGCLRAGDTAGSFMLTDVVMQGRAGAGDPAPAGTGTAGAGATAGGATAGGGQGGPPTSITLTADSGVDLKAHVGHKVEITGTPAGGGRRGGAGAGTTGTATGTTAGTGTTASGTATGTGTGSTSGTGTAGATGTGQGGGRGPRAMTVTSVRMISESCS
jgi:hypothetical protein